MIHTCTDDISESQSSSGHKSVGNRGHRTYAVALNLIQRRHLEQALLPHDLDLVEVHPARGERVVVEPSRGLVGEARGDGADAEDRGPEEAVAEVEAVLELAHEGGRVEDVEDGLDFFEEEVDEAVEEV